jgi:RNA polymerase sigma-70 factor (ECF subfamily)
MDQPQVVVDANASVEELELLYRQRFHQFVRVAQAITRSQEAAVDAVQEAFASVLHNRFGYRATGPLEAWVWRAVVNAARRTLRERIHDPLESQAAVAPERSPNDDVRDVLAALPERQRLVLFLRYYGDLDYRAIADALQIEVGTVGSTLNQAQRALKLQLSEANA